MVGPTNNIIRSGKRARLAKQAWAASLLASACLPALSATAQASDEIIVYATKRGAQSAQSVPIAITAMSAEQLDSSYARDLESLTYSIPNVVLDKLGPPGFANFAIRGLGSNSSIPSLDPAVGTFIDGIYLGTNAGVVQDFINLESVEVLRGPQGVLFGKNVAGGAVMLRTRRPGQEFKVRSKLAVNNFPGVLTAASVEGGLSDNLAASVTGYWSKDEGSIYNIHLDKDVGEMTTWFVRPALYYENDDFNAYITMDYGKNFGDGPPEQGIQTVDALTDDKHVVAQNDPCCTDTEWRSATIELNADVGFGDGTITSLTGWRRTDSRTLTDTDAGPTTGFNLDGVTHAKQISQELRYAGTFFDILDVTAGLYYFEQDLDYVEIRTFGSIVTAFGGDVHTESAAGFLNTDLHVTKDITLSAGVRYTNEEKTANIAPQAAPLGVAPSQCDPVSLTCDITFSDSNTSSAVTPRVAVQWTPATDMLLYASWGEGLRSGGYNLRHTSPTVTPRVTEDEEIQNWEVGAKTRFADGRVTFNVAAFRTKVDNMLRDTVVFVDGVGFVQLNQNAGIAIVKGVEVETVVDVTSNFSLYGGFGYLDNDWDAIYLDISGDTVIDETDYNLILPRLAKWSGNIGGVYRFPTEAGEFALRASYSYRGTAPYSDNNSGFLPEANMVDASLAWEVKEGLVVSVYGKNLLNEELYTSNVPAGSFGNIAYLLPPRQYGFEIRAEF
ncbi:MAG: TonB-dependent receptor [Pseudomonadota bacterium]|nr:TonB-dependent receptor [Pseudomonadota bacterium]